MDGYRFAMLSAGAAFAALFGYAAGKVLPLAFAAPLAMIAALIWVQQSDTISKHFRTDIERILQPNDEAVKAGGRALLIGLASSAVMAGVFGAAIAAVAGMFTAIYFGRKQMGG